MPKVANALGPKPFASLRDSHEIQQVLKKGRKWVSPHFVFFYLEQSAPPFKLAVAIKRQWDNAVYRNQTRRRIKEWFRLQKNISGHMLITQKKKFENKLERKGIVLEVAEVLKKIN